MGIPPISGRRWLTLVGRFPGDVRSLLESELRRWSGTWQVELQDALVAGWTAFRVVRDDGVGRTVLCRPGEQSPARVREWLTGALLSMPRRAEEQATLFPMAEERRAWLRR
jgi:hypothetical protein